MATKKQINNTTVTASSGNVFADLGLPNPEQQLLKAKLVLQVADTIKEQGLTQVDAAKILRIQQPHVSNLMRGLSRSFSAERLMGFLVALDHDVSVAVGARPAKPRRRPAQLSFKAAVGQRVSRH